jgi:succinate dehydrogenase cytochrome b556 subunit
VISQIHGGRTDSAVRVRYAQPASRVSTASHMKVAQSRAIPTVVGRRRHHLCGGIRHLVWDAGYGFSLRSIYASGWAVVAASVALTVAAWIASLIVAR